MTAQADDGEWRFGTAAERVAALDDLIYAAVCEGIDARYLSAKRDELYWQLEQGDHS
jgi:hypothetical protein